MATGKVLASGIRLQGWECRETNEDGDSVVHYHDHQSIYSMSGGRRVLPELSSTCMTDHKHVLRPVMCDNTVIIRGYYHGVSRDCGGSAECNAALDRRLIGQIPHHPGNSCPRIHQEGITQNPPGQELRRQHNCDRRCRRPRSQSESIFVILIGMFSLQ